MNKAVVVGGLVVGAVALAAVLVAGPGLLTPAGPAGPAAPSAVNAEVAGALPPPWQIDVLPGGRSRVMGLVLGHEAQAGGDGVAGAHASDGAAGHGLGGGTAPVATLADVQRLWPQQTDVAVIAAPDETGALEAFVDPAMPGGISGKLVVSLQAAPQLIEGLKARAADVNFMESTTRRFKLAPADLATAASARVTALSFVPQAQLDEAIVIARFGQPAGRQATGEGVLHYLYPAQGLDVAVNPKGKDVLQYVAPAEFDERLRRPLQGAAAR